MKIKLKRRNRNRVSTMAPTYVDDHFFFFFFPVGNRPKQFVHPYIYIYRLATLCYRSFSVSMKRKRLFHTSRNIKIFKIFHNIWVLFQKIVTRIWRRVIFLAMRSTTTLCTEIEYLPRSYIIVLLFIFYNPNHAYNVVRPFILKVGLSRILI